MQLLLLVSVTLFYSINKSYYDGITCIVMYFYAHVKKNCRFFMYLLWSVKLKLLSFIRKDCVLVATNIVTTCVYVIAHLHYYLHCINELSLQYLKDYLVTRRMRKTH